MVERCRRLVVLEALDDGTVDDNLVVLQLAAHDPECVVLLVVEDLHLAQAGRAARWNPLLLTIVVHHHRGACTDYALFAHHSGVHRSGSVVLRRCSENRTAVSVYVSTASVWQQSQHFLRDNIFQLLREGIQNSNVVSRFCKLDDTSTTFRSPEKMGTRTFLQPGMFCLLSHFDCFDFGTRH